MPHETRKPISCAFVGKLNPEMEEKIGIEGKWFACRHGRAVSIP